LLAKIEGLIPWQVYDHLSKCGVQEIYRTCNGCGNWDTFYYRCSLKFCPLCNWRIARNRSELLKHWTVRVTQPKHVVVTARNSQFITRRKIRQFMQAFGKLRRQKLFRNLRGGCVSFEITNEGRGWHLHAHALVDCDWVDAAALAVKWGKLVGQDYAIVKVKDCRQQSYLGELTKYVVKGAQLASWSPEEIAQFIHAIRGVRFFATFGALFKLSREIRAEINREKPPAKPCGCGCVDWTYQTEEAVIMGEIRAGQK